LRRPNRSATTVIEDLRKLLIPSVISISFFVFGFFVVANALDLALREIVIGLIAGGIGGITMLVTVLYQAHTAQPQRQPSSAT
jgi:hypothetical protein